MVSRFRMKVDIWGQSVLITVVLFLVFFTGGWLWTNAGLLLLAVWQLVSAAHLLYVYRHSRRIHYLRTAAILAVSLPVWIQLTGWWAYLPVGGVLLWYFVQTVQDAVVVFRRPRSFWDLT